MKVIILDDLDQEWLNELLEEGEIFIGTHRGSILEEVSEIVEKRKD